MQPISTNYQTALRFVLSFDFCRVDMTAAGQTAQAANDAVQTTMNIMRSNLEMLASRHDTVSALHAKSNELHGASDAFRRQSSKLSTPTWLRWRVTGLLVLILLPLLWVWPPTTKLGAMMCALVLCLGCLFCIISKRWGISGASNATRLAPLLGSSIGRSWN
mmetsp:Transcript_16018/g.35321  ORF Transcript_16018/g.35321 Transcript_16018/m.35321 type:complete len:162 (-) Transcript_16018:9-494(-)